MSKLKDVVCIDPGVNGGIAFHDGEGRVIVVNMPTVPPKTNNRDFTAIQLLKVNEIIDAMPHFVFHVEEVGPRPSDTPKTAWRFSANYYTVLSCLYAKFGKFGFTNCVKLQRPSHWQNQLGIELPSGFHNYDRRKKILKEFALAKFPKVERIKIAKNGEATLVKSKPTAKTADALCMLWVYGGFE